MMGGGENRWEAADSISTDSLGKTIFSKKFENFTEQPLMDFEDTMLLSDGRMVDNKFYGRDKRVEYLSEYHEPPEATQAYAKITAREVIQFERS